MSLNLDAAHSILRRTGVPEGWEESRLSEVVKIIGGGTPDRSEASYWRNGDVAWITPTDLTANSSKYISKGYEYISEHGLNNSNATLVPEGSIVFSTRGTVGNIAIAAVPLTVNQSCEVLIPKNGATCSEFLYYLLRYGLSAFHRLAGGTTFGSITRRDIVRVKFAFPPLSEQATIARFLGTVDAAIERTQEALEKARTVKTALVQQLFSEGARGTKQKKTSIGPIPESWQVVPISFVASSFQYGLSVPMELKGAIPILRMGNIQNGDVLLENLKYINLPEKVTTPYIAQRGDVFFNRTNSQEHVGKVGIYRQDDPVVFASYLIRVVPIRELVDNYYLGQLLSSYPVQCRIKRYATPGVQQVNINATNLGKVLIPLPNGDHGREEQQEIAKILEHADEVIRSYKQVLKAQEVLKVSLMHDLLTGTVRVQHLDIDRMINI